MRTVLSTFLCIAFGSLSSVHAEQPVTTQPSTEVVDLRADFVRLRNRGPVDGSLNEQSSSAGLLSPSSADSLSSWRSVGNRIEQVLVHRRGTTAIGPYSAARLTVDAADIRLRLWLAEGRPEDLHKAVDLLTPLANSEDSSTSAELRALAALMRGDAALYAGEESSVARGYYEKASLAEGVHGQRARERLVSLDNGTFGALLPSRELEAPRAFFVRENTGKKIPLIVLDPGHGGDDPGALGAQGLFEKDITLSLSQRVKALLEASGEVQVVLTRDDDVFVPLYQRTALANRLRAQSFVSLHFNATPSHEASGLEAYYLDNTDDKASRRLAERENGEAMAGNFDDLSFILSDLIQSGKLEDSIHLTRALEESVRVSALVHHPTSRSHGVKKAPFYVLVGAHMPCSLLELLFIDNPTDASKLQDAAFREALAQAVTAGTLRFVRGERAQPAPADSRARSVRASLEPEHVK